MGTRSQNRLATRAAIFDAAIPLFEAQGYEETSVEAICDAAAVGRATFFRHFDAKAGLLREHNRRLAVDAEQRLERLGPAGTSTRLATVAGAVRDAWVGSGPGLRRLGIEAGLGDPTGRRIHPELLDLVGEIVRAGQAAGDIRSHLPPTLTAYLVVTHFAAAAAWWFDHLDEDFGELVDRALQQCLQGIAPG